MKKILAAMALAVVAGLTACSSTVVVPDHTTAPETPSSSGDATPSDSVSSGASAETPVGASGVKETCELFNTLYAEYKALPGTDANGYEDIYQVRGRKEKHRRGRHWSVCVIEPACHRSRFGGGIRR